MHILPLFFVLDGWSVLIKLNPGSFKLSSSHGISEIRIKKFELYYLKYDLAKNLIFGSCGQEYYIDSSNRLKDFDSAFG